MDGNFTTEPPTIMEESKNNKFQIIADSAFAIGDIHGNFNAITTYIKKKKLRNTCLICCGDCCIGFHSPEQTKRQMKPLNKFCLERQVTILFLRGNHDEKQMYSKRLINMKCVKTVPDYSLIEIKCEKNATTHYILCVGGAISVDRTYRKRRFKAMTLHAAEKLGLPDCYFNPGYWDDEAPIYDEAALKQLKQTPIEYVCTHTAPHFCYPHPDAILGKWAASDSSLEEDVLQERQTLTKIYSQLVRDGHPLKAWFYGHFHNVYTEKISNTMFYLMDMGRSDDILSNK